MTCHSELNKLRQETFCVSFLTYYTNKSVGLA